MANASDPRTDSDLIRAINGGDARAFEAFYFRHRDWVARLARRFTQHDEDALDVLQETFAYLLRRSSHLYLSASTTTFLYPVVKNLSIAANRKRRRVAGNSASDDLPAPAFEAGSSRQELAEVLAALPETHREVLLMRFVDDMKLEEIAAALGIALGTVKSRLHNALQTLRDDERTRRHFLE